MPVYESPLLVEQSVFGVEFLDWPCLASGYNLNLTSKEMADLKPQEIATDGNNGPAPKKFLSLKTSTYHNCKMRTVGDWK